MNKYVISHHIQVSSTNKQFVVERISDKQKFNMTEVHSTCLNETIEFWCNCKHPNMIRIVDYFTNLDVLFIITEFCDIIDLRSFLQKLERYLPPDLIQKTLYELGSVVKVLHASSKYYAENVFVTKSNEMKLGYFSHANLSI
jgi:serine/threonine protein kinase